MSSPVSNVSVPKACTEAATASGISTGAAAAPGVEAASGIGSAALLSARAATTIVTAVLNRARKAAASSATPVPGAPVMVTTAGAVPGKL